MRAERMITTLLLMQARGRITAAELAAELEVSVATARRDLEALAVAGVPVYPQPGRGGGWSLVGGARTDLSGLTARESQALFTLLGPAAGASPETSSAVRKLLHALPGPFRSAAEAAAAAVELDAPGWGEPDRDPPASLPAVRQAVVDRRRIRVDYANRAGRRSSVLLDPLGLVRKDTTWYLLAARVPDPAMARTSAANESGTPEVRTYRLDRVAAVEVTDDAAVRPPGFDLAAEWRRVAEYVEGRRSLVTATLLVERRHLWVLRDHFGTYLELSGATNDADVTADGRDRVEVRVAAHTARSVAEQLAGWGAMIEVREPAEVRGELARIGEELRASYADS